MKQGAIFDMDGLMFDTESMYQEVWKEIAAEMGITLPDTFVYEICGTSGELLRSVVRKYYHTDDPDALFHRVVDGVEEKLKTAVPIKVQNSTSMKSSAEAGWNTESRHRISSCLRRISLAWMRRTAMSSRIPPTVCSQALRQDAQRSWYRTMCSRMKPFERARQSSARR